MEIYRFDTRLFMIMETNDSFTFEKKAEMDAAILRLQQLLQATFILPVPELLISLHHRRVMGFTLLQVSQEH